MRHGLIAMHKTARSGLFIGLAAALATGAMAQSALADPPSSPPAAINWTGFYVGGDVGAIFNDAHFKQTGLQETTIGTIDGRPTWGTFVGFNYEPTPWAVIGLEGDFNWLSGAYYRMLGFNFDFLQQSHYIDALAVRGGVLVRPDTLLYAKVGPAWFNVSGVQGFGTPFQQTLNAIQAGIGVEALITPNISVRGEASYTYANQLSLNTGADIYRPSVLMLQLGMAYKFDAPTGWGVPATGLGVLPPVPYIPVAFNPIGQRPPEPVPYWSGFYFGGFASANANQMNFLDTLGVSGPELGPFADFTVGGGWFIGANLKYQRVVIGAEASGNYENANFQTAAGSGGVVNFYRFANIDRVMALTGRLGVLVTPDTLLYGKAGPAEIRMTPDINYWNSIVPNAVGGTPFPGYEAGFGIESYVLPNLSVRLEAVYVHSDRRLLLNGVVPNEFTLQPSIISTTLGLALHL